MSKKDKGAAKTNAVRLLEKAGVTFETKEYPVDEEHLDARHVADGVGEDISLVFKTLVLKGERTGLFVCVIPGAEEVDLKKAARAAGDKKAEMLPMKELLPATGYIRGGCFLNSFSVNAYRPTNTVVAGQCLFITKCWCSISIITHRAPCDGPAT